MHQLCSYTECAALGKSSCEDCRDLIPAQAPDKAAEREGVDRPALIDAMLDAMHGGKLAEHTSIGAGYDGWREIMGKALAVAEAALAPKPTGTEAGRGVGAVPAEKLSACTKEEMAAFEAWAAAERYDMHEHPLHYNFMDPKTNAARMGWKAALHFAKGFAATTPPTLDGTTEKQEAAEEEIYQIGKRDGYEAGIAAAASALGIDSDYRVSGDSERHQPTPDHLLDRIKDTAAYAATPTPPTPDSTGPAEAYSPDAALMANPDAGLSNWEIAQEISALARDGRGITATVAAALDRKDAAALSSSAPIAAPVRDVGALHYGIIDPDYARVFTQARCLAWAEGYALMMHGSFTRDLDLIAVPWTDQVCEPEHLVNRIAATADLTVAPSSPGMKAHGRLAWTLLFQGFGDPRFVDLSIMPRASLPAPAGDVPSEAQTTPDSTAQGDGTSQEGTR